MGNKIDKLQMHKENANSKIIVIIMLMSLFIFGLAADENRDHQIKAEYIVHFSRFIYWPDEVFESTEKVFNICLPGQNPVGDELERLAGEENMQAAIEILYLKDVGEVAEDNNCHIIYLSESAGDSYIEHLTEMPDHVLTVSDIDGFSESGGMVEFIEINDQIRFEINVKQSAESGIRYRSQLLEVAERLR